MMDAETDGKPLYTHPDIRTQTHEQMLQRLQFIRDRRLVNAIQYESIRIAKAHKAGAALQIMYEKQDTKNRNDIAKIDELIDKLEKGISNQISISHKISLVEDL